MKEFFEIYLNNIINENTDISSKYIDKKFYQTFGHTDIFLTSSFFNAFPKDGILINNFVNKFLHIANIKSLKSNKEFLVYDPEKQLAVLVLTYVKGSYRHDVILNGSFKSDTHPSIQKTGQTRIIL